MKLKQQVPTLELCKKLKELGYPQGGLFWWSEEVTDRDILDKHGFDRWPTKVHYMDATPDTNFIPFDINYIVAPTVAELGELIPWFDKNDHELKISKYEGTGKKGRWQICYYNHKGTSTTVDALWNKRIPSGFVAVGETEANARAKMLIWLVENNYLSFKNS